VIPVHLFDSLSFWWFRHGYSNLIKRILRFGIQKRSVDVLFACTASKRIASWSTVSTVPVKAFVIWGVPFAGIDGNELTPLRLEKASWRKWIIHCVPGFRTIHCSVDFGRCTCQQTTPAIKTKRIAATTAFRHLQGHFFVPSGSVTGPTSLHCVIVAPFQLQC
jgi:hypothetical protein